MFYLPYRFAAFLLVVLATLLPSVQNGPSADKFTFAVVGDLHSSGSTEVPGQFIAILKEINLLRPDFIVSTGNLIEGDVDDETQIRGEWDAWRDAVADNLDDIPFFPLAGNHDIWSQSSEKLYEEIVAPLWYSFDYGDSHFIVLCSADKDYSNGIRKDELHWLENDLQANSDEKHIFCFIHHPMWQKHEEDGWEEWYDEIHPLLARYHVDYAFSGHWHVYEDYGIVDGIHYITTGGAGGTLDTRRPDYLGPFYHYLLVTVDGDKVDVAVMKIGAVLPDDVVTTAMMDTYREAMAIFDRQPVFESVTGLASYQGEAKFELKNPFDEVVSGTIDWTLPGKGWVVRCPSTFTLRPQSALTIPIKITYQGSDPFHSEWPEYKAAYKVRSLSEHEFTAEGTLRVVPVLDVHMLNRSITVDGNLDDWEGVDSVSLASPEYIMGFNAWTPEDISMDFYTGWDVDGFYLACEVVDDVHYQPYKINDNDLWMGDGVLVGFDVGNADNVDYGDNDFELFLTLSGTGPLLQTRRGGPGTMLKSGKGYKLAITREWEFTRYELAIDRDAFPIDIFHPGAELGFSILVSDNDGDGWEGVLQWNQGAMTYGKDLAAFSTLKLVP